MLGMPIFLSKCYAPVFEVEPRMITIAGVVLSVLVGLGLGFVISRNMLRQLGDEPSELAELALRIAGGDLDARFNPARPEIGVFGAMKQMVATLKGKIAEADQKSSEAREESARAQKATAEADEAAVRPNAPRPRACFRLRTSLKAWCKLSALHQKNFLPR